MKFDKITLTLSCDRTYFVEPEDCEDTGARLQNAFFRQAVQTLAKPKKRLSQENKELLHKQLDALICRYESLVAKHES